ncbi:MAG: flagellin [Pseudomonadota bacterium]
MTSPIFGSGTNLTLSRAISDIRDRLGTVSQEAVTGRRTDLTASLNGRIDTAFLAQRAIDGLETDRGQLNLREIRLDLVQQSLAQVRDASAGLDTRLSAALGTGDTRRIELAADDAATAIDQIFSALNVRHGERYLFAGDATDTPPFSDGDALISDIRQIAITAIDAADFNAALNTYFNDPSGGFQQTLYGGTPTASDSDAVVGIDPAIAEILSGLSTLALGRRDEIIPLFDNEPEIFQSAATALFSGQTSIINLQADRGVIQQRVEREQQSLDVEETILVQTLNNLTARDQFEAASELQELQVNLEAAFLITSRLANLSILNFVR